MGVLAQLFVVAEEDCINEGVASGGAKLVVEPKVIPRHCAVTLAEEEMSSVLNDEGMTPVSPPPATPKAFPTAFED